MFISVLDILINIYVYRCINNVLTFKSLSNILPKYSPVNSKNGGNDQ